MSQSSPSVQTGLRITRALGHARYRGQREQGERHRGQNQLRQGGAEGCKITIQQRVDGEEARHLRRRKVDEIETPQRRRRPAEDKIENINQQQASEERRQAHASRHQQAAGLIDP